jgi:DNA-binding NarL/FixJ family response regulator
MTPLTARQHEIAHLVADGLSNKQIARKVGISHYTVKNHVHAVLRKFDVTRRAALGRAMG